MTEFPKISRKKSVTNDLHQRSSPMIITNDRPKRSSSSIVINDRHQQSSSTIVIRDPGPGFQEQNPSVKDRKDWRNPALDRHHIRKNLQNPGPDPVQGDFLMVRGFLIVVKINVAKIYIPHSLMVLLPRVGPRIVKNMPFSEFTGRSIEEVPGHGLRSDGTLTFMFFLILLTGYCEPIIFLVIYPVESS